MGRHHEKGLRHILHELVRLIVIDEIPPAARRPRPVLESIVSRTIRRTEQTGEPVRLVGLSATLPNYRDVASFLRVDPKKGLFHFDGSFRPCPLRQEFIGVTDRKPIKQLKIMNDITYNKVLEHVGTNRKPDADFRPLAKRDGEDCPIYPG